MAAAKFAKLISSKVTTSSFAPSVARLIIELATTIKGTAHTQTDTAQALPIKTHRQRKIKNVMKTPPQQR